MYSRTLQVTMLRANFGRIKIRTNLLQRFGNNFGHFSNKFCHKVEKTIYEFSQEIADCFSIPLATLLQKNCQYLLKFPLKFFKNFHEEIWYILDKGTDCDEQSPRFESSQRKNFMVSRLDSNLGPCASQSVPLSNIQ